MNPVLTMPQAKKSTKVIDLKELRRSIQEDEKNDDKLLSPVGEKTSQNEVIFKIPASEYMPYRFDLCTTDGTNASKISYDTLLKLRATPNRIIKLMQLFK